MEHPVPINRNMRRHVLRGKQLEIGSEKVHKLEEKVERLMDKIHQLNASNERKDGIICELRKERWDLQDEVMKLEAELKRDGNTNEKLRQQVEQMQLEIDILKKTLEEEENERDLPTSAENNENELPTRAQTTEDEVQNDLKTPSNHLQVILEEVNIGHIELPTPQKPIISTDQNFVQSVHDGIQTMNQKYSAIESDLSEMKGMQKDIMNQMKREMQKNAKEMQNNLIEEMRRQMAGAMKATSCPMNIADNQNITIQHSRFGSTATMVPQKMSFKKYINELSKSNNKHFG